jgi:outer membrane protein assembly factor BamD (BamD/ComL family)
LTLTREHIRRFPSGALVQEREVLAIEALARLGRSSDAKHRLDAFRARFPQSPHIERLATLVGQ